MSLKVTTRVQTKARDKNQRTVWETVESEERLDPAQTALLLCDVWDNHWCRGAVERLETMVPRMNQIVEATRRAGIVIIHAPSGTLDTYEETPARRRILEAPRATPVELEHEDPPLPIDASDHGSDTGETETHQPWASQHAGIRVDQDRDVISDDGREIYSFFTARGIRTMLILGVHTNMCVLHRTFGIKQMVRWGIRPLLIRDLTDTMYNPAMPPYVSHEEGTDLVVGYIEKFWCPTTTSRAILDAAASAA